MNPYNYIADIDECSSNGGRGPCDSVCVDQPGTFKCSCAPGKKLLDDGISCQGRQGPEVCRWTIRLITFTLHTYITVKCRCHLRDHNFFKLWP